MTVRDKNLLDLPFILYDRDIAASTDEIGETYRKELGEISSPEGLRSFCKRWANLFLLHQPETNDSLVEEELKIVSGDFDAESVWKWLGKKSQDDLPFDDINVRIMMHIAAPVALVRATIGSKHWGVGPDLILVRCYLDPYPYDDACRYGSGDTRTEIVKEAMES